ncbi:hypothetical protein ACJQWK_08656 [Exserohilum turcicum]|uniref:WW domain-containing protein n=1 Tax=Exserohilum turcicum (strain 28A) TaxID=671987 RepID=R0ISE8_EXST2|nr:uncharacterized protein SETTUDRAFT_168998 [Exserohilum turcica Et28A]EOA87571.1 hypothetical protein SETTUDRAFT_168998 [Exserohilum turcica Et28A]
MLQHAPPAVAVKHICRLLFPVPSSFIVLTHLSLKLAKHRKDARMAFEAYIQRADDYITKQIHKFEQQKRGNRSPPRANGYHQMSHYQQHGRAPSQGGYPGSPASFAGQHPPPPSPSLPEGWIQDYDAQSQRWYYVEKATGRSQWNPPYAPPRASTFQPDGLTPNSHQHFTGGHEQHWRTRSNSQPPPPAPNGDGQFLDPRQNGNNNGGSSPGLHTQLPPGAHLDLKTGKVVTSMFPEGQTQQSWAQELQRL